MSKLISSVSCLLLGSVLLSSCGDSHDKAADDMVSAMNKMADALENVKDVESAKAAKPKFEAALEDFVAVMKRAKDLGDPDEATEKRLQEKMNKAKADLQSRMSTFNAAVQGDPEIQAVLKDSMEKFMTEMMKMAMEGA